MKNNVMARRVYLRAAIVLAAPLIFFSIQRADMEAAVTQQAQSEEKAKFEEKPVPIEMKWEGRYSTVANKKYLVLRDAAEWARVWQEANGKVSPQPKLPEIDFNQNMVVALFSGNQPTGGYSVAISKVCKQGEDLVVTVKTGRPAAGKIQVQTQTSPYYFAVLPMFQNVRWISEKDEAPR